MSWLGRSAAIAVLSFDVDAESPILAQGRRYAENAMIMSHQAYGPLVGVPRLLALLADYELRGTFFVPGLTIERYPGLAESIVAAGHEVAHHSYSHRSAVDLTDGEERRDFERALGALDRVGVKPHGHRAALWEASWRTAALVAEYGLDYDSSLMGDDRPYLLDTPSGQVVELPVHWMLDDWEQYAFLPRPAIGQNIESPSKVLDLWTSEFEAMRRHHCLFMLTSHPFLSGRPSRVETLRVLIEHVLASGDTEFATATEVAQRSADDPALTRRELAPVSVDEATYPEY